MTKIPPSFNTLSLQNKVSLGIAAALGGVLVVVLSPVLLLAWLSMVLTERARGQV